MELTPEQRTEAERQRTSGARSVQIEFTQEQREEHRRLTAAEEAGRDANLARVRKRDAAAQEPGFSGDLRRAINRARRPSRELAAELGIESRLLEDFRAGEADLPTVAIDRLVALLGLRLMAEIR